MRFPGFIGPSYTLNSVNVDCQRCINLFPEVNELGTGKEREIAWLAPTPGLSLLVTAGAGPIRGSWFGSNELLYVVSGNTLYKISSAWAATSLGTLDTSAGRVGMADNGYQLAITDGGAKVYVWDFNLHTFTKVALPSLSAGGITYPAAAQQIIHQDGYFIYNVPNSQLFGISGLLNATFGALDFSSTTSNPDYLMGMISDIKNLWLFNYESSEIFFNTGATVIVDGSPQAAFPFTPVQGTFIETGCSSPWTIQKLNGTIMWLGQDDKGYGMVYQAAGYQAQRISTHAIEKALQSYGDLSGSSAFVYQDGGHSFYCLNVPAADRTWCFDSKTNLWHERVYLSNGLFQRHRAETHSFAFNTHVVGDYVNGNLYKMSTDVYSDNGQAIVRQRIAPHLAEDMLRQVYSRFQLDIESGTGLDGTGQGTNPQAVLQWSDDGGHSWSNEKWTTFGPIGQTKARAIWRRLGFARDRVFKVTITDPVKVALIGAELDVAKGES